MGRKPRSLVVSGMWLTAGSFASSGTIDLQAQEVVDLPAQDHSHFRGNRVGLPSRIRRSGL